MDNRRSFIGQLAAALALFRVPRVELNPPPAPDLDREIDARFTALEHAPDLGDRIEISCDGGRTWFSGFAVEGLPREYIKRATRFNPVTEFAVVSAVTVRDGAAIAWCSASVPARDIVIGESEVVQALVTRHVSAAAGGRSR